MQRVGIIGCGHIFPRHKEAIEANSKDFKLVATCDIDPDKGADFENYKDMLEQMKGKMDLVVVATPNHLHYAMTSNSLKAGYDVLVEKPIGFDTQTVDKIQTMADKLGKNAWCVLQVRYNPTVGMLKEALDRGLLGKVHSAVFVQRWQRPIGYFKDWRGILSQGGRSLYEYAIHYLDILQLMFGNPEIKYTYTFNHKHFTIPFEDTLYSVVEYKDKVSGSIEVTVAVEPHNLECSISVMGSQGFVKLGGNALDKIERAEFEDRNLERIWGEIVENSGESTLPNSYGTHVGSCPNHPRLYSEIAQGRGFRIEEGSDAIKFIQDIYEQEHR